MFIKYIYITIFLITGLAWNISVQATEIFYGVRGSYGLYKEADLITINPATGALASVVGPTGINGIGGLAVNPTDGTIYAASSGDGMGGLYTLDPLTGAHSLVGDQGTPPAPGDYAWTGGLRVRDMAFDGSGTLFAIMAHRGTGSEGELVTIDLATGAITSIGGSFGHKAGIAFDPSNILYVKVGDKGETETNQRLHTVDPVTAAILKTVTLEAANLRNSLAIDALGTLYSHEWTCACATSRLVTIDPSTGAITKLATEIPSNDGPPDYGAAIGALDFALVPEPGTLGMIGVGLAGIGFARKKKRGDERSCSANP